MHSLLQVLEVYQLRVIRCSAASFCATNAADSGQDAALDSAAFEYRFVCSFVYTALQQHEGKKHIRNEPVSYDCRYSSCYSGSGSKRQSHVAIQKKTLEAET